MNGLVRRTTEFLRGRLWFIPLLFLLGALAASLMLVSVDRRLDRGAEAWFLYEGAAESARQLLGTIAAALITFTGLVFSITVLVLQQASSQFSPRVLRTFVQDRRNHLVLGIYIGTFTFALSVLAAVRSADSSGGEFVPALSVWITLVLVLVSLGAFVFHIDHIAHSIRAVSIIARVGEEMRKAIDRMYPDDLSDAPEETPSRPPGRPSAVLANEGGAGVVSFVDADRLIAAAAEADAVVGVLPQVGDFVPTGGPLLAVWGDPSGIDPSTARACVHVKLERTMEQDVGFGVRQLVDIAERGLSPAVNDPTTAVQAIDQIHDCLRRLAGRAFPSEVRTDAGGKARVVLPAPSWDDYVTLAFQEIRQYGERSIQIIRRLRSAIADLLVAAPPERRSILEAHRALLDATAERSFPDELDRKLAEQSDAQGLE